MLRLQPTCMMRNTATESAFGWGESRSFESAPLLRLDRCSRAGGCGIPLLCGGLAGGSLGVLVLELRVDLLGLGAVALDLVELGELDLRQPGGDGAGGLGGELVVEIDGLGIAAGLAV